jgi:chorismate synthase
MGIQAIKGVEVGDGFLSAARRGSVAHDEIERGASGAITRRTHRAGGTEGGMSTGEVLRVRAAMKPISTVPKSLDTIDMSTGEAAKAINQRWLRWFLPKLYLKNSVAIASMKQSEISTHFSQTYQGSRARLLHEFKNRSNRTTWFRKDQRWKDSC